VFSLAGFQVTTIGRIWVTAEDTINELCDLLKMSFSTVRLLVKDEPGVLRFQTSKSCAAKRVRTMYRIPESVLQRIIRRCTNPQKYQAAPGRRI
jgi:hypothetical protein